MLKEIRATAETAQAHFENTVASLFPGADKWHWFRALARINGGIGRHNDDTSRDEDLAASSEIREAHDAYTTAIHAFYLARDGEHGVLGGRGL